jgi:serine protease Do
LPSKRRVRKLGILAVDLDDKTIPLFGQLREYTGAVVAGVTSDLSLDHNGLQPGDVIHRLNETRVTNLEQLRGLVKDLRHSEVVALQIERMGRLSYLMVEID